MARPNIIPLMIAIYELDSFLTFPVSSTPTRRIFASLDDAKITVRDRVIYANTDYQEISKYVNILVPWV